MRPGLIAALIAAVSLICACACACAAPAYEPATKQYSTATVDKSLPGFAAPTITRVEYDNDNTVCYVASSYDHRSVNIDCVYIAPAPASQGTGP